MKNIGSPLLAIIATLLPFYFPPILILLGGTFSQYCGYGMLISVTYFVFLTIIFVYHSTRMISYTIIAVILYIFFSHIAPLFGVLIMGVIHGSIDWFVDERTALFTSFLGIALTWIPCILVTLKYKRLFPLFAFPALFSAAAVILLIYTPVIR